MRALPVITLYLLITVSSFKFGNCDTNEMNTASSGRRCTRVNDSRVRCSLGPAAKRNHIVHNTLIFVVAAA